MTLSFTTLGCVTRSTYEAAVAERDALAGRIERLQIERDSFEEQYIAAQESYEDERVTRTELASDLEKTQKRATRLDRDLEAER